MAGHIRKRGKRRDGSDIWRARYPDPTKGGTAQIEKAFRTRREAEAWLTQQQASVLTGTHIAPREADRPFSDVLAAWRSSWDGRLEPGTTERYEQVLRTHVEPKLARRKVSTLTHEAVQRYIDGLRDAGMAPGTLRKVHSVLSAAMTEGVRLGIVRTNSCQHVRLPRVHHRKMLFLAAEEVRAVAEAIHPHFRVLVYTAAYTGLRAGELGGLRRGRLDLLRGKLHVAEALKENGSGQLSFGPTKTHAERTVALPAFLNDMLTEHLSRPSPGGTGPEALVFTSLNGGPFRRGLFYRRHFKPAVKAALPARLHGLRFHDLRHTCASLLIAAGAHPKAIQERLGHQSITMTMDRYGHLLPSLDAALADSLDAAFTSAQAPPDNVRELRTEPDDEVSGAAGQGHQ